MNYYHTHIDTKFSILLKLTVQYFSYYSIRISSDPFLYYVATMRKGLPGSGLEPGHKKLRGIT